MIAKYFGTIPGTTTFKNSTSTVKHIFEIEGSLYLVEARSDEPLKTFDPIKVERLESCDVVMGDRLGQWTDQ
jgi:hypothetical protein